MAVPVPAGRRRMFNPAFVSFHDAPGIVSVVETDPGGAATVDFDVGGPSMAIKARPNHALYWLVNQRCADGAILQWCPDGVHAHVVELKQTITAKSWTRIKTQLAGMLANVDAVLGAALQAPPVAVTCHVAYAHDHLAASPVLSKVVNTIGGPQVLAGAEWASGRIDLAGRSGVPVNKIVWGSAPTVLGCP